MTCPKCNRENDPDARICSACGNDLTESSGPPQEPDVRRSELAVSSFLLGLFAIVFFLIGGPWLFPLCGVAAGILAFVVGIAGLVCIETSYGRLTGRAFAAIGVTIPVAGFFLTGGYAALTRPRCVAYHLYCGSRLSRIGKEMLLYSNDYDDQLPLAGGKASQWGPTANWQAETAAEAYGLDDGPGRASISANFYMLIKYGQATPDIFLCRGDKETTEFTLAKYKISNKKLADLWDFGPDPSKHCSYTYHLPYGEPGLTSSHGPGMAVAADRNPWLDTYARKARAVTEWAGFDPNGTRDAIKFGNATTHQNDGQNVLFVDGHTQFEKQPNCGVNDDNIYTSQNGDDIEKGALPTMTSRPANRRDSLLVHDPPKGAAK